MRFTIRDMLWLTLVAAVAVAWWVDHSRQAAENEQLKKGKNQYWSHYFNLDVF